jgi:hypothetical protein
MLEWSSERLDDLRVTGPRGEQCQVSTSPIFTRKCGHRPEVPGQLVGRYWGGPFVFDPYLTRGTRAGERPHTYIRNTAADTAPGEYVCLCFDFSYVLHVKSVPGKLTEERCPGSILCREEVRECFGQKVLWGLALGPASIWKEGSKYVR